MVEESLTGTSARKMESGATRPQFAAAFAANIAALIAGCVIGWTSPSLPKLEKDDSPIKITQDENSWISSLAPLAASLGPFAAGFLAERYGKKKTLIMSSLPAFVSWICLAVGTTVEMVYLGRFISGFTVGWIFTVLPMYCGEIAQDTVRGAIGSLMQLFICIGLLFDYVVGPYVSYSALSFAAAVFPFLFAFAFAWMPESPYYLIGKNRPDQAKKALAWLRGRPEDGVTQELKNIQADVENSKSQTGTFKDLFATRGTTKAMIISLGLVGFQQFSGINVILFNAETIFRRAGGSIEPEISTIITGAVMLVASATTPFVVERLGRRFLLLLSAAVMGIAHGVLGLCYYLDSIGTDTSGFSVLPVIAVLVYIVVYSVGFGPLPWAVMGEMFPTNIKSLASTLTASFCWLLGFLVTRFFNDLNELVKDHFTFWIFGICCFGAVFFVFFLLPETKGKSLVEIQEILNS
ncbi:UNVERIFIED_CONTAM: hypothetical protein PYX00_004356 [Menopon gallinae]|uniref:Major facilitator superfamily (MFS) profile domain-containing protein n=1 Tax=Menopon gallinae TaxID=328185 RepID=A0AAW2I5A9_9NEOP